MKGVLANLEYAQASRKSKPHCDIIIRAIIVGKMNIQN